MAVIYFIAVLGYLYRFIKHCNDIRFIRTQGLSATELNISTFVQQSAILLNITHKIQVWYSSNIDVPAVIGCIKPIILLPFAILNQLSIEQLNAVLVHEMAHIKRNDYLLNTLQSLICIVLFFNPFILLLNCVINKERENCCDDLVLCLRYNERHYAQALLILEERRLQILELALAATNNKNQLLNRIKRVVNPKLRGSKITLTLKINLICTMAFIIMGALFLLPSLPKHDIVYKEKQLQPIANGTLPIKKILINTKKNKEITGLSTLHIKIQSVKKRLLKTNTTNKQDKFININESPVTVFINQDALKKTNVDGKTMAISANNISIDSLESTLVQMEEIRSGTNDTYTYYLKFKFENGKRVIKPLLIIRKPRIPLLQKLPVKPLFKNTPTTKDQISI